MLAELATICVTAEQSFALVSIVRYSTKIPFLQASPLPKKKITQYKI